MSDGSLDRRAFLTRAGLAAAALAGGPAQAALGSAKRTTVRAAPRSLVQAIRGHVFHRGDPGFLTVAHVFNTRFDGVLPNAVARPVDPLDVRAAVRWLIGHGVPFRARSGGHSYAGYSTLNGGVVLDLHRLNGISLHRQAGTVTIGAGAQLIDVYARLAAHGVTIPAGSCPSVGITGVTLGGGMGLAARAFGMTLDNLVAIQLVTADGVLRTVSNTSHPELFWALRGAGGGNFGVVTAFTFKVHQIPSFVSGFRATWSAGAADEALSTWLSWAPHTVDGLTSIFHLDPGPSPSASGQFIGSASQLSGLLGALRGVPTASVSTYTLNYLSMQMNWAGCLGGSLAACHTKGTAAGGNLDRTLFNAKSDYLSSPLSHQGRQALIAAAENPHGLSGQGTILFDCYGGAINRVHPNATAFVHRNDICAMQYYVGSSSTSWLDATYASMRPFVSGMAYQNYIDASLPNWQHAYYGSNYSRLKQVRAQWDPHHHFNFPQAIG